MADEEPTTSGLVRREDLPPELAEQVVAELQAMHPGYTVSFAGDRPFEELPPAIRDEIQRLERALYAGQCLDCGAQMPDFPQPPAELPDDWQPPVGWTWFKDHEGAITAWQCPACDAQETADAADDSSADGSDVGS